jgi:hypothetical protein
MARDRGRTRSIEAMATLVGLKNERDWLGYKQPCDLSLPRDLVELAKDVGAMVIDGGSG